MRWSRYFTNTLREVPADADVISQKLMMRAGMIRKVAAGIYTYLPLGLRSIKKLEAIVRDEMNRAGAVELLLPTIQPGELWVESGRWQRYGKELLRVKDRHDRDFVYAPTAEEVITDTIRDTINSYRQLPINLYQIQTKFRDELRPRFGLMRGREFSMKDAYSFHASSESLADTYEAMRKAYSAVFHRCALDHVAVEADTGNIGGSASHEFMVLAQSGEDAVVSCPNCRYGANIEKATSKFFEDEPEPAPAAAIAELHTPGTQSIDDVGRFLNTPTSQLVKTLVFETDKGCVMVLVRGDREGNEIKIKNYLSAEFLEMMPDARFEATTGGPIGYCGPVGTKYSDSMNCTFLDEGGQRASMIMGCYGLGIGRTVAAAVEQSHDDDGIIWPLPIAPFEVVVTQIGREENVATTANSIYEKLLAAGVDAFLDDRDERPGVKFKDADLIGFPLRIAVGAKSLANGQVEWSWRKDRVKQLAPPDEAVARMIDALK